MELTIREMRMEDAETTFQYAGDAENVCYMLKNPDKSLDETKYYLEKCIAEYGKAEPEYVTYAVLLDGAHIGEVFAYLEGGVADIGWLIHRNYWGKGYATQAARLLLEHLRTHYVFAGVIAYCDIRNIASQRVMEHIGMKNVGVNHIREYSKDLSPDYGLKYIMTQSAVEVKPMETEEEILGKGYVDWKSRQEAYAGLMGREYLDGLTLEKCMETARRRPENILVAKDGDAVVGFAAYGACSDDALPAAGEIYALYVLESYRGRDAGNALMRAALEKLSGYDRAALWVLQGNERAIRFFQKYGFDLDGAARPVELGKDCTELRMALERE